MSRTHLFQRYSGRENTVTNNTLLLLSRIYSFSPQRLEDLMSELFEGTNFSIGLNFQQQRATASRKSIPDATITQAAMNIVIETKVDAGVYIDQLTRHAQGMVAAGLNDQGQNILLLLTRDSLNEAQSLKIAEKMRAYDGVECHHATFAELCSTASELFSEYETEMRDWVDDFEAYCREENLIDVSQYTMRIVPCTDSFKVNRRHGVYFHPASRSYSAHRYVGLYRHKAVRAMFELESVFDASLDLESGHFEKRLVSGNATDRFDERIKGIIRDGIAECGYHNLPQGYRFFCGEIYDTFFEKRSKGGIMGPYFKDLANFVEPEAFEDTATLAHALREQDWM